MKNIELVKPELSDYWYEEMIQSDPDTMGYNAFYDVSYFGYHYDTGCIDFPKEKWKDKYDERIKNNVFFAYIKDIELNTFVGYTYYLYNKIDDLYECGILIEYKYRGNCYSRPALRLMINEAYNNGIDYLYDTFEVDRGNTLNIFKSVGFYIDKEVIYKKKNKNVNGVIVKINTNCMYEDINNIKNIYDVLEFMKKYIRYGWIDSNNCIHVESMKDFRRLYRTMSIDMALKYQVGTCIEQVNLMHYLLDRINVKNEMFCTRVYESDDFDNLDEEEHMHCFILAYVDDKVYHIEHPNWYNIGIYEYKDLKDALEKINAYFEELSDGVVRPLTKFYKVDVNLTFREFNKYINSLVSFNK